MNHRVTKVHPHDNVLVALANLEKGESVSYNGSSYVLTDAIPAKHKFVTEDLQPGDPVTMYGVLVGKAQRPIAKGGLVSTSNLKHAANSFAVTDQRKLDWPQPDVERFRNRTFMGFHRPNGQVGTANYWLVVPMVFCENRNLNVIREALVNELGYGRAHASKVEVSKLIDLYKNGSSVDDILAANVTTQQEEAKKTRLFPNVDGIKFLNHTGGCGGTRQDAQTLCGLLAGYITHPNVAGATVLSLGCQNAQVQPSADVRTAISAGVNWLQSVRIEGYKYTDIQDASQPKGKDRVVLPEAGSVLWARFYDIETGKPFFCGRDGVKKWSVAEIEHERRIGYAWYGNWAQKLLDKDYPAWQKKQAI